MSRVLKGKYAEIRKAFAPSAALVLVLYSLYKAVSFSSYTTNFGTFAEPLGYVSNGQFMVGAGIGNVCSCSVVLLLYGKGWLKPFGTNATAALSVSAALYLVNALFPERLFETLSAGGLGVVWGIIVTILSLSCVELLVLGTSPLVPIVQLALASFLMPLIITAFGVLPRPWESVVYAVACLVTALLISLCRRIEQPTPYPENPPRTLKRTLQGSMMPILAASAFELVVGLVNTYASLNRDSFVIADNAPVWGSAICSALVILFVLVTSRAPRQQIVYNVVFPGVIAVFLLLPFFGTSLSVPLSTVVYSAYAFTTMLSLYCVVMACRSSGDSCYGIMAIYGMSRRLFLMAGLALGWYFGNLTEGGTFVRVTIVCVASVYILGIIVGLRSIMLSRRRSQETVVVERVTERVTERVVETFEQSVERRVEELVDEYQLSHRERDVLVGLAQGYTAAAIAEVLHLSTSTVQGYIKSLYLKLGVNKKQQVIDLFKS